ncbi:hypothetical protein ACOSQ4_012802 [Xanthoceras sorbifolium]
MGVPLLALPMNAEQPLNAKQVVNELNAGLRVEMGGPSGWGKLSIRRHTISEGVRELMGGKNWKKVRTRAEELGRAARQVIKDGKTSYNSTTELMGKFVLDIHEFQAINIDDSYFSNWSSLSFFYLLLA